MNSTLKQSLIKEFTHVSNLPITLMIVDYNRPGSDFFQSLLDGHNQILQIPGNFIFHDIWDKIDFKIFSNIDLIFDFFIKDVNFKQKIFPKLNETEKWNQLGDNKNETIDFDFFKFKNYFFETFYANTLSINSKNIFLLLHLSFFKSMKYNILNTSMLFYHIHRIDRLSRFQKDFKINKLLIMTRDIRDGIVSYIESRKTNYFHPASLTPPILTYIQIYYLYNFQNLKVRILPLENLHSNYNEAISNFCKDHSILKKQILFQSTFFGKKWWGDTWSKTDLNGFQRDFKAKQKWKLKRYFKYEINIFNFLFFEIFKKFKFETNLNFNIFNIVLIGISIILPMKYEIKIFLHNIKHFKFHLIKYSLMHYLLRVKYMTIIFIKRIFKKPSNLNKMNFYVSY